MRNHIIIPLILLLCIPAATRAQYYAKGDTTYEYSLKGTVYANKFEGRKTASGEVFRQNLYTAAHWKIKLGTLVLVTCPENGRQLIVKVNDRCGTKGVIDLTRTAADALGIKGVKKVVVRQLPDSYYPQWESQSTAGDLSLPQASAKPATQQKQVRPTPPKRNPDDDEDEPQY